MQQNIYDIIIIGGGPAGLTAGIYAARDGLKALLLERMGCGGQAVITDWIENYPGFPEGINGFELAAKMQEQAKRFGLEIKTEEVVTIENISTALEGKVVNTTENTYKAAAIIIATGANFKPLQVPGEKDFIGKGVSYCATCDGPFFKGKNVTVIGGGDSAVQEAAYLTRFASEVTVMHRRDRLRAAQMLQQRVRSNPKIKFKLNSVVEKIYGKDNVESLVLKNTISGEMEEHKTDGVFIFIGQNPNTGILKGLVAIDERGFIITDEDMRTSSEGIFACGDARKKILRQVVTACGDGALAAFAAQEYIDEIKGTSYDKSQIPTK